MFKEEACGEGSGHESAVFRKQDFVSLAVPLFDVCSAFPEL